MKGIVGTLSLLLLGCHAQAEIATPSPQATQVREWQFDVYLDDKPIGSHQFRITDTGASQQVETSAAFDVRILFFNAFSYRHTDVETWRNGCLHSIESRTDTNGKKSSVSGSRRDNVLQIDNGAGGGQLDGCVMTFAYWNRDVLQARRLLNAQTGLYEAVSVEAQGRDTLRIGDTDVEAEKFTLAVKDREIRIWYTARDGTWLALESPAKGDRVLRYRPSSLPVPTLSRTEAYNES